MSIDPKTIKNSTNSAEITEEKEFLANIGLTTMTEARQRQQKKPKKVAQDFEDDELFIKRPDYIKREAIKVEKPEQRKTPKKDASEKSRCSSGDEEEEERKKPEPICCIPGKKLYNFLKQLSSHRWIWCEFVESFLDKPILACGYDLERFITECCPTLKTRCLPRRGWQLLRRFIGKARRFSPAFIEQEREEIERARRIVRQLQQYRFNQEDSPYLEHIPKRIPLPLVTDAKVTGFLQGHSLKGITDGCVMDYDPQNSTYVVRFVKNGKTAVLSLQDTRLHSDQDSTALPLSIMMHGTKSAPIKKESGKTEKFGNKKYNKELLESVLQVKKLLEVKQKTVMDISEMNEDFEGGKDAGPSSSRREAKMTPQREKLQRRYAANMITLHRVNSDVLEPLHILHEHLADYQKQEEEQEFRGGRPASEVYQKCRMQAELDLKTASIEKSLKIQSDRTREFICNLHTILYLNGRLGREYNCDMEAVLADLISHMVDNIPPSLGRQFKESLDSLEPLRQEVLTIFKCHPKPEPAPMQTEDGVYNFEEPSDPCKTEN